MGPKSLVDVLADASLGLFRFVGIADTSVLVDDGTAADDDVDDDDEIKGPVDPVAVFSVVFVVSVVGGGAGSDGAVVACAVLVIGSV